MASFLASGMKHQNFFPAPPKNFSRICENALDFRIVFALGDIFPQYPLA
jgi:hypothetical protein